MIKKTLVSCFTALVAVLVGYVYPISCSAAFDIKNDNYLGCYNHLTKQISFIDIKEAGYCNVMVVYSPLEHQYLSATRGAGYINNRFFRAEFSSFVIKDSSGNTIRTVDHETYFSGTVDYNDDDGYIDIIIGGIIYEKLL